MSLIDQWHIQYRIWGYQRLESEPVRGVGAFYYIVKYLLKNLDSKAGDKWSRIDAAYKNEGRLYRFSRGIGNYGNERWRYLVKIWIEKNKGKLPPNWIQLPILGKMEKIYIPKDEYVRTCKKYGIRFTPQVVIKSKAAEFDKDQVKYETSFWEKIWHAEEEKEDK